MHVIHMSHHSTSTVGLKLRIPDANDPILTMACTGWSQERKQIANKLLLNEKCSEICRMMHRTLKRSKAFVIRKLQERREDDE